MRILAVDLGMARTGLACSDPTLTLASPVGVLHEKNTSALIEKVAGAARENQVQEVVVGYPKHMNNTAGEMAARAQAFAEALHAELEVPVVLWDERGTTLSAHGYLNETNTRGKKRKAVVDAVAAVIILENYMAWRRNQNG